MLSVKKLQDEFFPWSLINMTSIKANKYMSSTEATPNMQNILVKLDESVG